MTKYSCLLLPVKFALSAEINHDENYNDWFLIELRNKDIETLSLY